MKKLILFALILSFSILAQENEDKFIAFKPVTWTELQLYQLDSMLSVEELKLSKKCPTTLRKIQESHERTGQHFQNILYANYIWSEYTSFDGLRCLVKHEKIDTITPEEGKIINPNHYELLNTNQARVLLSASQGVGFKEKGLYEKARQANLHNQEIKNKPYKKYGGLTNVALYMEKNKPSYEIDPKYLENRTTTKNGSVVTKHIPLIELFEMRYSNEQKQDLINIAKKLEDEKKSKKHKPN